MIRTLRMLPVLALVALPVLGDDWRDRERWGRGGYGRDSNGREGYGREGDWRRPGNAGMSIVNRTMADLRSVASRNRVDSHERNHFERAMYHLDRFQYRWSREGRFDTGRLNDAIEHIDDLAKAHQIRPRDRQLLARDLAVLREFRSTRGDYGRW